MKIAVLGRGANLLRAAELAYEQGHEIKIVWTCKAADDYAVKEINYKNFSNLVSAEFSSDLEIGSPENLERLASLDCDIALSVNWLSVLSQDVLDCFSIGVLNAHAGDLPRYRGNACPNWAILNGESRIGLCVHLMNSQLDAGPVVIRQFFELKPDTYIGEVYEWLGREVPKILIEALNGLTNGNLKPVPQSNNPDDWLRCYPRRPEDGQINWACSTNYIYRLIRATSRPFAGAYTKIEGETKLTVWRAEKYTYSGEFLAVPGQVCRHDEGGGLVACSDGMLRLTEVQLDGSDNLEEAMGVLLKSLRTRLI